MSSSINRKPYEVIDLFVPAAATPAAANGLLTIYNETVIPVTEIDRVENVEAPTAGTAHEVDITFSFTGGATTVTANAEVVIGIFGFSAGHRGAHPTSVKYVKAPTGTTTLNQLRDWYIQAVNDRKMGITATSGGAGIVTLTFDEPGISFKVQTFTDDPTLGIATAVIATAGEAIGQQAALAALFPHLTIPGNCSRVRVWRTFKTDSSDVRKALYNIYCEVPVSSTLIQNALDGTGGAAPELQVVEVN
jgi:hypothetical protein